MGRLRLGIPLAVVAFRLASPAIAAGAGGCAGIDTKASKALGQFALPTNHRCTQKMSHGFPIPDPDCTPGAFNPTVTVTILKRPSFKTDCLRDKATSAAKK